MKTCPHCKRKKPLTGFSIVRVPRWKGDEYSSWCRVCNKKRWKGYYQKNKLRLKGKRNTYWNGLSKEQKEAKLKRTRDYYKKRRLEAIEKYGSKCVCCGETEIRFLEIDHINNDGAVHRKKMGSSRIINWLRKRNYPKGFQLLCSNCNMAKGRFGECPHTTNTNIYENKTIHH